MRSDPEVARAALRGIFAMLAGGREPGVDDDEPPEPEYPPDTLWPE
jgi:hypothetical protein